MSLFVRHVLTSEIAWTTSTEAGRTITTLAHVSCPTWMTRIPIRTSLASWCSALSDARSSSAYAQQWGNYTPTITLPASTPTTPPATVVTATSAIDAQVTAPSKFMNYAGCYSDSPARSMSFLMWTGNSTTTIQGCVAACANAGYTVSGIEFGTEVSYDAPSVRLWLTHMG
jgi:hypothetical protein